ncbi:hypothetical protein S40285_04647 [Stachybotrys chlorohalonatus IBT 40285]|uniref:Zn(2)-C6 fungal-type domain-containing protein n=1 Tax=Stachybotrys chlorohalonatus (strain IBT 40285) TaxID=1283841 RepID=A0A084QPF7_STAC4|nr:hypothetical protein S40285_04647 [Stachybotrys chlorohalonata IBT 40285]
MAEEEANSGFSQDEASSPDETPHNGSAASPPRKRKREKHEKTSCELCKARKVKCDRAEPACSWCARHNRTCVYLERQKPGSRIGFTLELEAKVNRIDALLQALGRRVEEHIAKDQPSASHASFSPSASNGQPSSHVEGLRQEANASTPARSSIVSSSPFVLSGSDGNVALHDGSRSLPQHQQSVGFSTSNAVQNQSTPSPGGFSVPPHAPSLLSPLAEFPPQDMVYTLVDLYFKHCNTWCPILDRKNTFTVFFGSTSLEEADRILLHAIVATTLRFFKDSRLPPDMRTHHHAVSRHAVQVYALEHVSIAALRALVIICLDELGTSNGPRGFNLLSLLAQYTRQLGLCEEVSVYLSTDTSDTPRAGPQRSVVAGRPETWIEDEGRRRLCWMVYLLDRYATIGTTNFDFMLDDGRMKRLLPCSYDLFSRNVPVETRSSVATTTQHGTVDYAVNKPENLGSFSYHCEILRIFSKVHDFLKAPIDVTIASDMASWRNTYRMLDGSLDHWLQSLPSEYNRISALCHSDPASRVANWFMLHSAYVVCVVRLHSPAAYPVVKSHIFVPSHYAMQRCLSAVQSLGDIVQDVSEANGLDLLGPPFAFSLWVAARLLLVHAATIGCPLDPRIDFFIETLTYVGQYWEVANTYARTLQRVVQRGRTGELGFAAMRKSAYELVTLTSSTRQSGLEQTSSQTATMSEIDSMDVFDFFNYPKVAEPVLNSSNAQTNLLLSQRISGPSGEALGKSNVPDPESDWFRFGTSFT